MRRVKLKKVFSVIIMAFSIFSFVACGDATSSGNPIEVDMVEVLEKNFGVTVEEVYTTVNIDPNYETDNSYIYLTKGMEKQFNRIRYENPCNLAWLNIAYVKTNLGDSLILFVEQIRRQADLDLSVIMINYPYEYTAEEMKTFLQNLELEEPLLIDFENFSFRYQYKHSPYLIPEEETDDETVKSGCFTGGFMVSDFSYLKEDFNPASELESDFVWVFTAFPAPQELRKLRDNSFLWYDMLDATNYRVFVKAGEVYITMANETTPETYIYPTQEPV